MMSPSRRASLKRLRQAGVDRDHLAIEAFALHVPEPDADRGGLAEDDSREPLARVRRRHDRQERARPALLHLNGRVEHVERTLTQQPVHQDPENLRVHVVDLGLDHDDRRGTAAVASASPSSTRRTFGVSAKSRAPAP